MGVGVVDEEDGSLSLVYSGVLSPPRAAPLPERLLFLHDGLVRLIEEWRPNVAAVEEAFVPPKGAGVRTAIAVGQAQGIAMVAAARRSIPIHGYAPREVKRAVTDYGGSSKGQVQQMVALLLGLGEPPEPSDVADALAVAVCHINASRALELGTREASG